ncbi:MAG: T9SS type A sorting domain-containing protein [Bacteroidales bacterium]
MPGFLKNEISNCKQNLILFLILFSNLLNGQVSYSPVNFDHGRWVFISNQKGPFWGTEYEIDTLHYYFSGDTTLNTHIYRKLYYLGKSYSGSGSKTVSGYAGAFRDDTVKRTVWFGEGIAYDYNLSVTDTIKHGFYQGMVIASIDSVNCCGKYFRRFVFSNTQNEPALIENIRVLDVCITPYVGSTGSCTLDCYYETNNTNCTSCAYGLGINPYNPNNINIYPNPTEGKISINSTNGQNLITLFNSFGARILERSEKESKFTIDMSGYSAGIYTIRIVTKNGISIEKIIKK